MEDDVDSDVLSSPFFQSGGPRLWSMEAEHAFQHASGSAISYLRAILYLYGSTLLIRTFV